MDESNVLDSGFLERMNTLLANGEVRLRVNSKLWSGSLVCLDLWSQTSFVCAGTWSL